MNNPEERHELIVINQLPIIEEQLAQAKVMIDERTSSAVEGTCTEENYKAVKALRTALNKEKKELDSRYKAVMDEVTAPLKVVQTKYKECVSGYVRADSILKERINTVEKAIKSRKESEAREYFDELTLSEGLDEYICFEDVGLKVTMTSSNKSLRTAIAEFTARVRCDLAMIKSQDNADEVLVEYKRTLNASEAILTVQNRRRAVAEERRRREEERERVEQEQLRRYEMELAAQEEAAAKTENEAVTIPEVSEPADPKPVSVPDAEVKDNITPSRGHVRLRMNFRAVVEGEDRNKCMELLSSLKQFAASKGIKLEKI